MPRRTPALPSDAEAALVGRARSGDRRASSQLLQAFEPALRDLLRRFVGQPDDVDDLTQDVLLAGFEALATHEGSEPFAPKLDEAAVKTVLAFLSDQRRWRPAAQIYLERACADAEANLDDVQEALSEDGFSYDVREHVAFCFTQVSRSLPLEQQTALLLVDVLGFDLERAAALAATDVEHLRTFLSGGRATVQALYEKMCRLAVDDGVCDQCRGLRDAAPDARKGPVIGDHGVTLTGATPDERSHKRLQVVRDADLDRGASRALHDLLYRMLARIEANRETPAAKDAELPAGRWRWEALQSRNN
jgi:RNA polymerase sigma-70 factor (ECF subfamily)